LLERLDGLLEEVSQQTRIKGAQLLAEPAGRGHGALCIEAIRLPEIQERAKAQFEGQERMVEQEGAQSRHGRLLFAETDQKGLRVGALGMSGASWTTWSVTGITKSPVDEGEHSTIALHNGIDGHHGGYHLLVKLARDWYDRDHEGRLLSK
jgi:hypothetical protein